MGQGLSCFGGSSKQADAPKPPRPGQGKPGEAQRPVQPNQAYGKDGYIVKGQLGTQEGTTMKLLQNKKTRELVAAKFIPRVQGAGLNKNTEREIVNHRKLLHPNIIRFREVFMTDEHLVIVMEYASGGPLEERVATSGPLPEEDAKKFYRQLVDGMGYCHIQSIYHRDLRMENLLLDGNYFESTLKISNFGYSKSSVLDSMAKTAAVGAPAYTPPELLLLAARSDGSAYDGAAIDVWASGIILYCLLTGKLPFLDPAEPNTINARVMQRIVGGKYDFPKDVKASPECMDLIAKIFTPDPAKRIKTEDIKRHPWLSGMPLPQVAPEALLPASQTEDDIKSVVERAKRRREHRVATRGSELGAPPGANGVAQPGRPPSNDLKSASSRSQSLRTGSHELPASSDYANNFYN